jgi:hypothetical protein
MGAPASSRRECRRDGRRTRVANGRSGVRTGRLSACPALGVGEGDARRSGSRAGRPGIQ